jgi:hypothetical protein
MRYVFRIPVEIVCVDEDKEAPKAKRLQEHLLFTIEASGACEARDDAEAKLRGLIDLMHTWRGSRDRRRPPATPPKAARKPDGGGW